jgi:flagellar hook-basal body complex protein FliE
MSAIVSRSLSEGLLAKLIENGQKPGIGPGTAAPEQSKSQGKSFTDMLSEGIEEVSKMQKTADKMAVDVSTGKSGDLHEAMLAATQAELSFNLMVQIRNKALEAYQDIMRMPV